VLRYEDADGGEPIDAPLIVLTPAAGSEGPVAYRLNDDGSNGDPVAGDRRWGAWAEFTPGLDYAATLHDADPSSTALHRVAVRFEAEQASPTVYFRAARGAYTGAAEAGETAQGASVDAAAPPAGSAGGGLADAPPRDPTFAEPLPPPGSDFEPPATVAVSRTLAVGLATVVILVGGVTAWWFTLARPRVALAGTRHDGRPFGVSAFPEGAVSWVVPAAHASAVFRDALRELASYGAVVVVPRADTALDDVIAGTLWRLPGARPDPLDLARTPRRLGPVGFVVEGPDALEAPINGEAPTAVMDELRTRVGRAPILFVLRDGEPLPAQTRVVRFREDGDALVAEGVRLCCVDGRWRRD
jgi:hypothetical protein